MQSRRRFLASAGGLAAATIVAPASLGQALAGTRRVRRSVALRSPRASCPATRGPNGITSVDARRRRQGDGLGARSRSRSDRGFRKVVAREGRRDQRGRRTHASRSRVKAASKRTSEYYYRFFTADARQRRRALPDRSAARLEGADHASPSCPARSTPFGYYNAQALLAKEDVDFILNLGDYIYADVSLRSAPGRPRPLTYASTGLQRRHARQYRDSVQGLPHRQEPAEAARRSSPWSRLLGRPRGPERLLGRRSERRHGQRRPLHRSSGATTPTVRSSSQMPTSPDRRPRGCTTRPRFGRTLDLFVLDERQYRAAQPLRRQGGASVR